MVVGCGIAIVILAVVYCFFGYRLARFVLPVCGVILLGSLMYLFFIDFYVQGGVDTWIFVLCCVVALYVILFLFKRLAGFFVGAMGAALILTLLTIALNLNELKYINPIIIAISLVVGLLSFVYKRKGVIIATSLFGGPLATVTVLFLAFGGSLEFSDLGNFSASISSYVTANSVMITSISIFVIIVGVLVQAFVSGTSTVLPGRSNLRRETQQFGMEELMSVNNESPSK